MAYWSSDCQHQTTNYMLHTFSYPFTFVNYLVLVCFKIKRQ